ncbi:MAG TPA: hypothetical protein VIJ27_00160 [Mucilaginibacter sp.]
MIVIFVFIRSWIYCLVPYRLLNMLINNYTAYVGKQKRWIEIRPLYTWTPGKCPELSGEYIIYSNAKRNAIGELQHEANQDNSILGSFFYSILEDSIVEFKGQEILRPDEIRDIKYSIKSTIAVHYASCFSIKVSVEPYWE